MQIIKDIEHVWKMGRETSLYHNLLVLSPYVSYRVK